MGIKGLWKTITGSVVINDVQEDQQNIVEAPLPPPKPKPKKKKNKETEAIENMMDEHEKRIHEKHGTVGGELF